MANKKSSPLQRISKIISEKGLASRREADELIKNGMVTVNGKVAELGEKALASDNIVINTKGRTWLNKKVSIVLNKPLGYVSSQAEGSYKPAIVLIKKNRQWPFDQMELKKEHLKGLAPAGRLDIDSTGLLILTQDGVLTKQIIGENSTIEKEYLVWVKGEITNAKIKLLCQGLSLDGKLLKPAKVTREKTQLLRFVLKQGRKRQIRRMCELVDLKVTSLKRVRIGNVRLGSLKPGQWRFLKNTETFK